MSGRDSSSRGLSGFGESTEVTSVGGMNMRVSKEDTKIGKYTEKHIASTEEDLEEISREGVGMREGNVVLGVSGKEIKRKKRLGRGQSVGVNWDTVRKHYIVGERKQLEDNSWVSEDISLKELSNRYDIAYSTIRKKAHIEGWVKLRKGYLARVNEKNLGFELSFYTQENFAAEIAAMNTCNKLGKVLETYIEGQYGEILRESEDLEKGGVDLSDELKDRLGRVNNNTGVPVFINELSNAVKVTRDIYDLQRKIYENAPKEDSEVIEEMTGKTKFNNDREREIKLKQLQNRLQNREKDREYHKQRLETYNKDEVPTVQVRKYSDDEYYAE